VEKEIITMKIRINSMDFHGLWYLCGMLERDIYVEVLALKATRAPAIVILGARQVGKTTLAIQFAKLRSEGHVYLDMESPTDRVKLADPEAFFAHYQDQLVILDEVQQMPEIFSVLRSVIDKNRRVGRFLLLGSASPHLVKGVSESLAGRVSYMELSPLGLQEITPEYSQQQHWYRGGFPQAFLAPHDADFQDWAQAYVRSYIERDFSQLFGYNLNSALMERLWLMVAHAQGGVWNSESYARALGVTAPVVNRYLDFMEGAFLVRRLKPWFVNSQKRLVKSPKVYVRDSGLVHYLNRVSSFDDLQGHLIVGGSWEGYVIEQIIEALPTEIDAYYYRTHNGAEADLVLVKAMQPLACIEIKYSNAPTVSKGFYASVEDLGTTKNFVITPHSDAWPIRNAWVCNLQEFVKKHLAGLGA
jgi:uncharacterized protein